MVNRSQFRIDVQEFMRDQRGFIIDKLYLTSNKE